MPEKIIELEKRVIELKRVVRLALDAFEKQHCIDWNELSEALKDNENQGESEEDMSTTREKIAVMEAFDRGEEIESTPKRAGLWRFNAAPMWDWINVDYRIKAKEPFKPKHRDIPIDSKSTWLQAEGYYLNQWLGKPEFVGFRYANGDVHSVPVITQQDTDKSIIGVVRAIAVVVEA